jgi:hypothetical protein
MRDDDVDRHSALLTSRPGRVVVALVLVVGTWSIVAPNLPASAARDRIDGWWDPAIEFGLVQDWGVFSPNPRSQSIDVRARIEYDDGAIEFWDVPEHDPLFGAYRQYRWNKWQERIRLDSRSNLWEPTAEWLAAQNIRNGAPPTRITLIRRWIDHEPLTSDGEILDGGWNEFEFYVWERPA